ncbi:unnamed protein product [Dicrocoelium dendriticum]|nr:unnamed protein product [Dicrocoelium dendriticum]
MERDVVLADFQACTGIDNLEYCISLLEAHDWNLGAAVTSALADSTQDVDMDFSMTTNELPRATSTVSDRFKPIHLESKTSSQITSLLNPAISNEAHDLGASSVNPSGSRSTFGESHPVTEKDTGSVLDSGTVRILHFDIELELPTDDGCHGSGVCSERFTFPDTETVGSLKQHFIDLKSAELILLATSPAWISVIPEITPSHLLSHLSLQGPDNYNFNDNSVTLRTLHLPKYNSLRATLTSSVQPTTPDNESPNYIEIQLRVSHPHSSVGTTTTTTTTHPISLRFPLDSPISRLRQDVAKLTGIPSSHQLWSARSSADELQSLSSSSSVYRLLDELIRDSAASTGTRFSPGRSSDPTFASLGLHPGTLYFLNLSESSAYPDHPVPKDIKKPVSRQALRACDHVEPDDGPHPACSKRPSDPMFPHSKYDEAARPDDPTSDNEADEVDIDQAYSSDELLTEFEHPKPSVWNCPLISDSCHDGDPAEATEQFCRLFMQRYCVDGETMAPPFITGSLESALQSSRKPLFIYLHNDESIACHVFCQQILCSTELCQFFGENDFSVWPWDVTRPRAKERLLGWLENKIPNLSNVIKPLTVDSYPVLSMVGKLSSQLEVLCVVLGTGASTSILNVVLDDSAFPTLDSDIKHRLRPLPSATTGSLKSDLVLAELWQAYTTYSELLAPELAAESDRIARQRVREEQEAAYLESLRLDQLKALTAEKQRLEQQRVEEQRMRENAEAAQRRLQMAATLPSEPPDSSTPAAEAFLASLRGSAGIASLRFRLPRNHTCPSTQVNGVVNGFLVRRFAGSDKLSAVFAFMESQGFALSEYKLLTTYPRKDLTSLDASSTLADLKLVPQETLTLELR